MAYTQVLLTLPPVPEFIGREVELEALDAAINAGGQTRLVLITGQPGVGRTRLFTRWLEAAPHWQCLIATPPRPGPVPGGLASEVLRAWAEPLGVAEDMGRMLGALEKLSIAFSEHPCGRDLREGKHFLARLAGFEPNHERERSLSQLGYFGELISAMRGLLECVCRQARAGGKSSLLFLDDLDAADRSSCDLLDAALQGIAADQRPVVVATSHLDDGTGAGLNSLAKGRAGVKVEPFAPETQNRFIARMLRGFSLPEKFNETLWRRTGGNALAIEQQLRLLVSTGILQAGVDGRWGIAEGVGSAGSTKNLPALIADVMRGLPGPTLQAVVAASATGLRAKKLHLAAVVRELGGDPAELDRHCVRLVRQGFLRPVVSPEGEWAFRHPLMYEACSLVMPLADQRQFHRTALAALGPFASVSGLRLGAAAFSHALQGQDYDEALAWADQVARGAERMGLTRGVIETCERAMPLFANVRDNEHTVLHKANIVMAAGRVWMRWDDVNRAVQAHALLPRDESLSEEGLARVLAYRAELHGASGRFPGVLKAIEKELDSTDPQSLRFADLSHALGNLLRTRGEWARARESYNAARIIYETHRKVRPAVECLHQAAVAYRSDNQLREAEVLLDEALHMVDRIGDRADLSRTLISLGILHGHRGDLKAAETAFRGSHDLALAIGDYHRADQAMHNIAACRRLRGFTDEARDIFREILDRARQASQWSRVATSLINLAEIEYSEGNFDSTAHYLNEARGRIEFSGNMFMLPNCLVGLVMAHVGARRFYEARGLVEEARRESRQRGQHEFEAMALACEGEICEAGGEIERALECFDTALRTFDDYLALGKTTDDVLRADITRRYAWFLVQHERDLADHKLVPEGPRRRAVEFLKDAEIELRERLNKGFGSRKKDLDRVVDLLGSLQD